MAHPLTRSHKKRLIFTKEIVNISKKYSRSQLLYLQVFPLFQFWPLRVEDVDFGLDGLQLIQTASRQRILLEVEMLQGAIRGQDDLDVDLGDKVLLGIHSRDLPGREEALWQGDERVMRDVDRLQLGQRGQLVRQRRDPIVR